MQTFRVKNFDRFQHYKDRAPPWIKLYNELLDDYEFGLLPDATKMHLVAIWLLASRSENKIPFDPAWVARRINANSKVDLALLAERNFIVVDQLLQKTEQDASTPQACCLSREREETEGEKSREDTPTIANATRRLEGYFARFKAEYPRREGANPWQPAERKFVALVKSGVDPEAMIAAVKAMAVEERRRGNVGTKFIPQALTWLNQQRFVDHTAQAAGTSAAEQMGVLVKDGTEAWDAWQAYLKSSTGKGSPKSPREDGWRFETEYPPGYERRQFTDQYTPQPQMRSMQ